jgi:hypothetical protein
MTIKNNPAQRKLIKKCNECEKFATLFLQLKKYYQLKKEINYACRHQQHQDFNQIKSVEIKIWHHRKLGRAINEHCPQTFDQR